MFTHLNVNDLTYVEHAKGALSLAFTTLTATGALLVHTVYPDVFTDTATEMLYKKLREFRPMKDSATQTEETQTEDVQTEETQTEDVQTEETQTEDVQDNTEEI